MYNYSFSQSKVIYLIKIKYIIPDASKRLILSSNLEINVCHNIYICLTIYSFQYRLLCVTSIAIILL